MRTFLLALVLTALATPTLASDGVLEINQTCAVQTGCFSGDTAGYPVTIDGSAGSSYLLTGDLTVPDANTSGVVIDASYMTIDLGGHRVSGPVSCTSTTPIVCSPSGTGRGVSSGLVNGVRIRNGSVTGMGDLGVAINATGSVEEVISTGNAGIGIFVGAGSAVDRCRSVGNGGNGISGTMWARVSNSASLINGGMGISVGDDSTVSGNAVSQNQGDGINAGARSMVSQNAVSANHDGIRVSSGSTVSGNTVLETQANTIGIASGALIRNNVVSGAFIGIGSTETSQVEANNVSGCSTGVLVSSSAGSPALVHAMDNVLLGNEISLEASLLGSEVIAKGNWIDGTVNDVGSNVTLISIGCNRIGNSTICPP